MSWLFKFFINMFVFILAMCNNPLYVLHINGSMRDSPKFDARMCCSGFLIARTNTTTCLENGEWELEISKIKSEGGLCKYQYRYRRQYSVFDGYTHTGNCNSDNASLRSALISVSCLLVVASVLIFIIGFVCGHCFSQRCRKLIQHKQSMPTSTAAAGEIAEDLELKENVAYVTLRPKWKNYFMNTLTFLDWPLLNIP